MIVLAIANLLMHLQALGVAVPIGLGWRLGIAVVIVLISVIGGRIVPAFTSNWLGARGLTPVPPSIPWLEIAARGTLIAAMLGWVFLPDWRPLGVLLLVGGGTQSGCGSRAGAASPRWRSRCCWSCMSAIYGSSSASRCWGCR